MRHPELFDVITVGQSLLLDDGKLRLEVLASDGSSIRTRVRSPSARNVSASAAADSSVSDCRTSLTVPIHEHMSICSYIQYRTEAGLRAKG